VFVPGKPFQPSLMFAGKAGAYPRVEHLMVLWSGRPLGWFKFAPGWGANPVSLLQSL